MSTPESTFPPVVHNIAFTIPDGTNPSAAINLYGLTPVGIIMPGTWSAAALTFQGSVDGVNFYNLYDDAGTEVSVTAAASILIALVPSEWAAMRYLKVRSGTAAVPVDQNADRALTLLVRPVG